MQRQQPQVQRQQPQVQQRQQPQVQRQQPQVQQRYQPQVQQRQQPQVQQRQQPQVQRDVTTRPSVSTNRQSNTTSGASHWPNSNSGSVNQGRVTRPDLSTGNMGSGRTPTDNRGTGNVNNGSVNNGRERRFDNNSSRLNDHGVIQQNDLRNNNNRNLSRDDNRNTFNRGNDRGNNNRGNGFGNNDGRRPGDNGRGNGGHGDNNRTGYGPSDGGINHNGPGSSRPNYDRYSYSSDHRMPYPTRNGDRFHNHYRYNDWSWHSPMRPPHRPYRPASLWYYRPVVPVGFRYYVSAPVITGVLGLEFGTPFGSSLNFLYYNGYEIDGYCDNIVYLRDVPMLNYVWSDAMLQYDYNGLTFVQFTISSPYDDRGRFNRLYNDLCMAYGTPIRRAGYNGYYSWYGGNGVGYVNLNLSYDAGRYFTILSFGY